MKWWRPTRRIEGWRGWEMKPKFHVLRLLMDICCADCCTSVSAAGHKGRNETYAVRVELLWRSKTDRCFTFTATDEAKVNTTIYQWINSLGLYWGFAPGSHWGISSPHSADKSPPNRAPPGIGKLVHIIANLRCPTRHNLTVELRRVSGGVNCL